MAGAALLAGRGASHASALGWGALLIALAYLSWGLDNNLTRKVSASDAVFLAGLKGLIAGVVNTGLAFLLAPAATSNSSTRGQVKLPHLTAAG